MTTSLSTWCMSYNKSKNHLHLAYFGLGITHLVFLYILSHLIIMTVLWGMNVLTLQRGKLKLLLLLSCSVVSDSVRPHRRQPTRLLCPWDSPGKSTGMGCHSFSNAWKWKVKVKSLSCVRLLVIPWTVAYQALPFMGFSRQEHWSGLLFPSPNWSWKWLIALPKLSTAPSGWTSSQIQVLWTPSQVGFFVFNCITVTLQRSLIQL